MKMQKVYTVHRAFPAKSGEWITHHRSAELPDLLDKDELDAAIDSGVVSVVEVPAELAEQSAMEDASAPTPVLSAGAAEYAEEVEESTPRHTSSRKKGGK